MIDWQPIATAPRDGQRTLAVISPDLARFIGWDIPPEGAPVFVRWIDHMAMWMVNHGGVVTDHDLTYWAPVPSPPEPSAHQRMRDAAAIAKYRASRK